MPECYRGANTFHNANRLTVSTVANVTQLCEWTGHFENRGDGWCRPVSNFTNAGPMSTRSCALRCLGSPGCLAFAVPTCSLKDSECGHCALYTELPTNTSGDGGFQCFARKTMKNEHTNELLSLGVQDFPHTNTVLESSRTHGKLPVEPLSHPSSPYRLPVLADLSPLYCVGATPVAPVAAASRGTLHCAAC
eukprot:COSAG06_NODE_2411_length_6920_cov_64.918634_5_plen_192_part_00